MSNAGLTFEVFTIFPDLVDSFVSHGLMSKAIERGVLAVHCTNYRDFAGDRHGHVDDAPFGGGGGMLIKPEPVLAALESVTEARGPMHRVLLTPSAPRFDQRTAERLAGLDRIGLICGRYEGINDRVREGFVDECLSLGDFVLNGGEVAAAAIIEAVGRLREGVLGNPESARTESFAGVEIHALLEHPHYTRPAEFRGMRVPEALLAGDHEAIERWRLRTACVRTWELRPELRPTSTPRLRANAYLALPRAAADAPLAAVEAALAELSRPSDESRRALVRGRDFRNLVELRKRIRRESGQEPVFVHLQASAGPPGTDGDLDVAVDCARLLAKISTATVLPLVLVPGSALSGSDDLDGITNACTAHLKIGPRSAQGLAKDAAMINVSQPDSHPVLRWAHPLLMQLADQRTSLRGNLRHEP